MTGGQLDAIGAAVREPGVRGLVVYSHDLIRWHRDRPAGPRVIPVGGQKRVPFSSISAGAMSR
jgi:hypothetical protein